MLAVHPGKDFFRKYPNEICILKSESGFNIKFSEEVEHEVHYYDIVMHELFEPSDCIDEMLGMETRAHTRIHISEEAYQLILKACEINEMFFEG